MAASENPPAAEGNGIVKAIAASLGQAFGRRDKLGSGLCSLIKAVKIEGLAPRENRTLGSGLRSLIKPMKSKGLALAKKETVGANETSNDLRRPKV